MGENKHINELDAFAKKHIQEIEAEKPSVDFTNAIMKSILTEQAIQKISYEPLISKKVWFVIIAAVVSLFFIPIKAGKRSQEFLDKIDLSIDTNLEIPNLFESLSFDVSNSFSYAILLCAVMIIVQIVVLKNYFQNRMN
ncbi:MAG: hypothetical protein CMB99_05330 [Flavobacteriaceae bacterium]|nr:hypothetical protein [Flavobacteriaceae bacterium]|tara:strand:- start:36395 stop:36811 length:417 start_codon:yes stop_codon:yes gene_type:complete